MENKIESLTTRMGCFEEILERNDRILTTRMGCIEETLERHDRILRGGDGIPGLISDLSRQVESMNRIEHSMESISKTLEGIQKQMYRVHGAYIAIVSLIGIVWSFFQYKYP